MTSFSKGIAACVLVLMAGVGALSFWSELRNERDREWVIHTLTVVEKLQALRIDITQAETGQRGYILTGQDRYLEQYAAGLNQIDHDAKALADLTSDNPGEQDEIRRLNPMIAARLTELADGIEVRKQSGLLAGAEAVTHGNNGELWMELIATHIAEMRQTEAKLLSARLDTAAASTRKIKIVIVLGNALAILILLIKGFVLHRETSRRNVAEEDLKNSNERLVRRTSELSEANIELESFAYSVAHDLRAPLRHVAGYAAVVVQDFGPRLDVEGVRCLEKITDCAQKMGTLVDDLLSLSQVGRQALSFQDTSLNALLATVIEEQAPECAGRVEWQVGELFSAECDPGLMKQVFVNLVSNAVKYSRKREHALIQVGQMMQNGERVVFVRDNGVGFEMQHASKLFGVFQRLHKARDFEGTGVGLAIVQRVIRKHGGRIWAEAELDQGATFFFTLGTPENIPSRSPEVTIEVVSNEEEMHVTRS